MTTTHETEQTGQMMGKYQLLEPLGRGGMAQVFRAHQPNIERSVAIKVMHPHLTEQGAFVERFKREARNLGQLRHPHIVSVIDFDVVGTQYFMVMDFIEGPTLADVLQQNGALPPADALLIAEQVADALAYAHARGTIHRDVKPANIMFLDSALSGSASRRIARRPSGQHVPGQAHHHAVLTDFGVARLLDDARLTDSGMVTGTPYYMSPEAANGTALDARTDIYSLGVVLYEMVTGETPYKGTTPVRVMMQHVTEPLPSLRQTYPHLPEPVVQVIERALAKHPDARFENAKAMQGALLQALLATNDGHMPDTMLIDQATIHPAAGNGQSPAAAAKSAIPVPERTAVLPPTPPAAATASARATSPRFPEALVSLLVVVAVAATWIFLVDGRFSVPDLDLPGLAQEPTGEILGQFQIVPTDGAQDLTLRVDAIDPPPPGQHYHIWLESSDGILYDLGALTVTDDAVQHHSVAQQNILGTLARVLVTLESDDAPQLPGEQVALQGEFAADVAAVLEPLLVAGDFPGSKPLLPAAAEQIAIAQDHAALLQQLLDADDLPEAQRHAEHVVNILDGERGETFGDLNLDGQPQNPGDGVGVRAYLDAMAETLGETDVETGPLENAQRATDAAIHAAQQITAADSAAEAEAAVAQLSTHLHELLNGTALDGSGAVEADRGEGAFLATTESVRALSSVSLRRGAGLVSPE